MKHENLSSLPDEARIDVKAVGLILGVRNSTVWEWAKIGKIPSPSKIGRTTRWRIGAIRELIREAEAGYAKS